MVFNPLKPRNPPTLRHKTNIKSADLRTILFFISVVIFFGLRDLLDFNKGCIPLPGIVVLSKDLGFCCDRDGLGRANLGLLCILRMLAAEAGNLLKDVGLNVRLRRLSLGSTKPSTLLY